MSERLTIIVIAPTDNPDLFKVQEVFAHVLELFELAVQSESDPEGVVAWKLVGATMNSPFKVTAEAVSVRPGIDIADIAQAQKREFAHNINELSKGRLPRQWSTGQARRTARSVFQRNCDGIGTTNIDIGVAANDEFAQIVVTRENAAIAVQAFGDATNDIPSKPKEQIGSIEGHLIEVGSHYKKPAILVRERRSGTEIWCLIPEEFRAQIAKEANFEDVWNGRRVSVRGRITYERGGSIARVFATEVHRIAPLDVELNTLLDPSFTSGLSVTEYLEKLREGNLG